MFALSSIITCSLLSKSASLIAGKAWAVTVAVKECQMLLFLYIFIQFRFISEGREVSSCQRKIQRRDGSYSAVVYGISFKASGQMHSCSLYPNSF